MRSYMLLLIFSLALALATAQRVTYEGYKVYKIHPNSVEQVSVLYNLENELNIDYWTISKLPNLPAVALIEPENLEKFEKRLNEANIEWNILIGDVKRVVEEEYIRQFQAPKVEGGKYSFDEYLTYDKIETYINKMETDYPSISQKPIGITSESKNIIMVNICHDVDNCDSKPKIFLECGIHAREWIVPAMCLYVIQELVNPENLAMIENVDWHIVPVMNVDGYEYSHTTARFWRKTRRDNTPSSCKGVDAERNFDAHWAGNGINACSENYPGASAESELEVQAIQDIVKELNLENPIKLYLSIHSYGQYILYPYSWVDTPSANAADLEAVGQQVAKVIQDYRGSGYLVGSCNELRYKAGGTSLDWAHDKAEIDLTYTIELPGGGNAGFDLPADRILGVVQETFEGIKEFHKIITEGSDV